MKRPTLITIITVLGFLSILVAFPQVFSPSVKKLGMFMPALYGLLVAFNFIAYVGVWYMKKWGAELFAMVFFAKTIFFITTDRMGVGFWISTVFQTAFMVVFLLHYAKMSKNL